MSVEMRCASPVVSGVRRELYISNASNLIDMEVAYVYALASLFDMRAIAIKGIFELRSF